MSDQEEDLEVLALQRQLDDAFETTRPRRDFEDELWARMQSSRPAPNRFRDAIAGFFQGIRVVPAVPAAAVATLLVVVIGVGLFAYSGLGTRPAGGSGSTAALSNNGGASRSGDQVTTGMFGVLPSPVFGEVRVPTTAPQSSNPKGAEYAGPAQIVWAGQANAVVSTAPVFRYREPTTNAADQFASSLGAVLRGRPEGFLGNYYASDYTLKVRGTIQSPPSSPAYFIFASLSMQPVEAAGAGPDDLASIFLAEHSLKPQWSYTVRINNGGDPVRVVFERQFEVPGYGLASLVDSNGMRYGIEVDLTANRPVLASGLLPVSEESAYYSLASPADAIRPALVPPAVATLTPPPTIQMTRVELVYVLVPAGDHSFYEPAYLYSGNFVQNGVTYTKHLLESAVDQSQRRP